MKVFYSLMLMPVLWLGSYIVYRTCNHGLASNAKLQQLLRYLAASAVAVVPLAVSGADPFQPAIVLMLAVSFLWVVTYPLCYHLTHRHTSPDYDHRIDGAFGIYLFGWLTALTVIAVGTAGDKGGMPMGLLMFALLLLPFGQWVYFLMYRSVPDESGMLLIQNTDYNEVIEFVRSYSIAFVASVVLAVIALAAGCVAVPMVWPFHTDPLSWWQIALAVVVFGFTSVYLWKPRRGLFVRTGIMQLFLSVKEYVANNRLYADEQDQRLSALSVHANSTLSAPHTIILVIGESASRDYMSAFTDMAEHTTPWMKTVGSDAAHCILFPNAYSCDIQTVPTLTRALTELNQYDGGVFYKSCSIIDIAHQLGYRVHWYSNQGQIGAADTPITLIANTADVTKWTRQQLNQVQYDEALLDFMDEVDPTRNNLVVFHLMGSHFNYENRFTEATRQWGSPANHDPITNYKNALYYTDQVLKRIHERACERLNLQAMVYFSDHSEVPDRHRQPQFNGFAYTRIPLMVWMGDDFISVRPHRAEALRQNKDRYWTNDLAYELMCGLMDAGSNRFREDNSLASATYRFKREELTAMGGKIQIKDDYLDKTSISRL